ncbi:hypothetical protein EHO59_07655 [Leptospira semungkisensis]|uniref:Uncharacterized protein n=1 Tax=Leptospira semungkisensis TaxID=2484985 RepID=A0A4R9GA53_9LEPT|nr:hypothetical protein [Leptospira semungkisensis]TGK07960.1 hypothetical protein EHO59_07655 [Leptospira semungkisensis]
MKKEALVIGLFFFISYSLYSEKSIKDVSASKPSSEQEEEEDEKITTNIEFASDFIFRGNTFGSESISQRDDMAYRSFLPAYAFQPSIEIPVTKKLSVEFWFNLFLTHKGDRDSDQRFLQTGPSGMELLGYYQPQLEQGKLPFDPRVVHPYKEQNGLKRDDGGEILLEYDLLESEHFGNFSVGIFSYNTFLAQNRFSWTQMFISWKLPILRFLEPKLSFYKTTDPDTDAHTTGINKGSAYIPLELQHQFEITKDLKFIASTSVGYIIQNNPTDRISGFSDITTQAKIDYKKFFFSVNMAYRPNLEIYDSSYFFDNVTTPLTIKDGRTVDPSKQYGLANQAVISAIESATPNPVLQQILIDRYQGQHIKREIYYFTLGFTKEL